MAPARSARAPGALSKLRHITLPLLSPTIFFNLVVGVIAAPKVFATAYVSTQGRPGLGVAVDEALVRRLVEMNDVEPGL